MKGLNQTKKAISPGLLLGLMQTKRYRLVLALLITLIAISFIVRLVLMISSWSQLDGSISNVLLILLVGLFFDLANASYFFLPIIVLLWLTPDSFVRSKGLYYTQLFLYFLLAFIIVFSAGAEYFFWSEFNSRFNFIAVDYLIYTTEVIGNIKQSYPIEWIVPGQLTIVLLLTWQVHRFLKKIVSYSEPDFWQRGALTALWTGIVVLVFFTVDVNTHRFSTNRYVNELSGNGIYDLFAAYRNNELNYEEFYANIDSNEATAILQSKFEYSSTNEFQKKFPLHQVINKNHENKWNVVLISVESLSAEFLGLFGNKKRITPHLDSLAAHSTVFTNLFATGTRTVRGLEALTLSIPPTPGQSIVRRPNNENLFSLGSVFREKGYHCKYIYGGYGYFDNMNYFFEKNGYEVIDRTAIPDNEIDYENIWGVADENLFELSIKEIDKSANENQLIFAHIMTTSNHRPYTYPEGRIDIPSHTNRDGAVKYTDYAIGKFLREASLKPWYKNTLFIIVADHCASSAGKVDLPPNKYKIPMMIWGPGNVRPQVNNALMSQIDVAPTILGLLNFSYQSKFYGYDIFRINPDEARAFISTYQTLGYLRGDSLTVLKPQQKVELHLLNQKGDFTQSLTDSLNTLRVTKEAISWYQNSSLAFKKGLLKK
ncbi:MAG: sulfatase-like hydrolase/transferase [Cytophagales bacterium]|nr:sulfatase-like hydrolase/transferase [Cytophagales bacterium]